MIIFIFYDFDGLEWIFITTDTYFLYGRILGNLLLFRLRVLAMEMGYKTRYALALHTRFK